MRACVDVQQGKLCELVPVQDGVLLACVASRKPAEAGVESFEIRKQISDYLSRETSRRMTDEWQESLLADGKLKDLMATESAE
ncbi:MAG: hypothetical protein MUC65_05725, partial [Pontiellaceae bacterium]|jgi:hypothetical protein|nr:hypothetical protein [Pontiellaceae bacterium]